MGDHIPVVVAYAVPDSPPPIGKLDVVASAPPSREDPQGAHPMDGSALQGALNEGGAREYLSQHHWPPALQEALLQNLKKTPIRFFICDDSGSMAIDDGSRVVESQGKVQMVKCSRWTELGEAMRFHVGLAHAGSIPTEFRMLNSSAPIHIGFDPSDPIDGARKMLSLFDNSPGGGTPLCRHIRDIAAKIAEQAPRLRSRGQRACVIIATDGESSDGSVSEALRPLKDLPCWVVVRLCTNEDKVVDYWNNVDAEIELEIDVLDDLQGEAQEIRKVNPWLSYNNILHRMREFGVSMKEFDMLDESRLSHEHLRKICSMIYGKPDIDRLPLPEIDIHGFCDGILQLSARPQFQIWSPAQRRMAPWVDSKRLASEYGQKTSSCIIS